MDDISGNVHSNLNLSSSLSSVYAAQAKTHQQMAFSMNLTSEEMAKMRKETSGFRSLNMSADELAGPWQELHRSQVDIQKVGFKSFQEFIKYADVAQVDAKQLAISMGELKRESGFTDEELGKTIDTITHIGQQFGMGSDILNDFGSTSKVLRNQISKIIPNASTSQIQDFHNEWALLTGAMKESGASIADAPASALELISTLTDTRFELQKMMQGAGSEVPDFLQEMVRGYGSFEAASKAISDKPTEFITQLGEGYHKASDEQKRFIEANFFPQLGDDARKLITEGNFDKAVQKMESVRVSMENASGSAQKSAKHFRSALTAQEQFGMMQEDFEHRLVSLASSMGVQSSFLSQNRKMYKSIGDAISTVVKLRDTELKQGQESIEQQKIFGLTVRDSSGQITTLGHSLKTVTRLSLSYKTAGLMGLITETQSLIRESDTLNAYFNAYREDGLSGVLSTTKDLYVNAGGLKGIFKSLGSSMKEPEGQALGLAGALGVLSSSALGLAALKFAGIDLKMLGTAAGSITKPIMSLGSKALTPLIGLLTGPAGLAMAGVGAVAGLAYLHTSYEGGIRGFVSDMREKALEYLPDGFAESFKEGITQGAHRVKSFIMEDLPSEIGGIFTDFGFLSGSEGASFDALGGPDKWKQIGVMTFEALREGMLSVLDMRADVQNAFIDWMGGIDWNGIGSQLTGFLIDGVSSAVQAGIGLGKSLLGMLSGNLTSIRGEAVSESSSFMGRLFESVFDNIHGHFGILNSLGDALVGLIGGAFKRITGDDFNFGNVMSAIITFPLKRLQFLGTVRNALMDGLATIFDSFDWSNLGGYAADGFVKILGIGVDAITGIASGIFSGALSLFDTIFGTKSEVAGEMKESGSSMIYELARSTYNAAGSAFRAVGDFFLGFWNRIGDMALEKAGPGILRFSAFAVTTLGDFAANGLETIFGWADGMLTGISHVESGFYRMKKGFSLVLNSVKSDSELMVFGIESMFHSITGRFRYQFMAPMLGMLETFLSKTLGSFKKINDLTGGRIPGLFDALSKVKDVDLDFMKQAGISRDTYGRVQTEGFDKVFREERNKAESELRLAQQQRLTGIMSQKTDPVISQGAAINLASRKNATLNTLNNNVDSFERHALKHADGIENMVIKREADAARPSTMPSIQKSPVTKVATPDTLREKRDSDFQKAVSDTSTATKEGFGEANKHLKDIASILKEISTAPSSPSPFGINSRLRLDLESY